MAMITAHSGCDGTEDNSLDFIRYALDSDAGCLEVDVRKDWKGELVLSHDEGGKKNTTLREAFSLLKDHPEKKINCDLKTSDLETQVYRLAKEMQVEEQLIYSGEVNPSGLGEMKKRNFPEARIYFNIENLYPKVYEEIGRPGHMERLAAALEMASNCSVQCVNMEYHLFTDRVCILMKHLGLTGSAWTVNEEKEIQRLLERAEVENITTRNLKEALKMKKEMESE